MSPSVQHVEELLCKTNHSSRSHNYSIVTMVTLDQGVLPNAPDTRV